MIFYMEIYKSRNDGHNSPIISEDILNETTVDGNQKSGKKTTWYIPIYI